MTEHNYFSPEQLSWRIDTLVSKISLDLIREYEEYQPLREIGAPKNLFDGHVILFEYTQSSGYSQRVVSEYTKNNRKVIAVVFESEMGRELLAIQLYQFKQALSHKDADTIVQIYDFLSEVVRRRSLGWLFVGTKQLEMDHSDLIESVEKVAGRKERSHFDIFKETVELKSFAEQNKLLLTAACLYQVLQLRILHSIKEKLDKANPELGANFNDHIRPWQVNLINRETMLAAFYLSYIHGIPDPTFTQIFGVISNLNGFKRRSGNKKQPGKFQNHLCAAGSYLSGSGADVMDDIYNFLKQHPQLVEIFEPHVEAVLRSK